MIKTSIDKAGIKFLLLDGIHPRKAGEVQRHGTSTTSVNFPEVALPAHPGKHRLLHIHRNVPGVLSKINKVFADNRINIASQYLQTNDAIGYVVIDIDAAHSDMALVKLAEVSGTIRSRVLF